MTRKNISNAVGNISAEYIEKAASYTVTKKNHKATWTKWGSMAACFCLCALLGVGVWQSGIFNHDVPPINTDQIQGTAQANKDNSNEGNEKIDTLNPAITYSLSINEIASEDVDGLFSTAAWLDPGEENFHEMTRDEVLEYFGAELNLSEVSPNYHPEESERYGFYHFADGSVLDQQNFRYVNDTGAEINITLRKGKLPMHSIVGEHLDKMETSQIGDYSVVVAHYTGFDGQSVYYAEFMKAGNGYTVITNGVSGDELTAVLTTLLQ